MDELMLNEEQSKNVKREDLEMPVQKESEIFMTDSNVDEEAINTNEYDIFMTDSKVDDEEEDDDADERPVTVAELPDELQDYWEDVRHIGNVLAVALRCGDLPADTRDRVLVMMARPVCAALLEMKTEHDEVDLMVAAARVVVDELPYLRNGSARGASDGADPDEQMAYYIDLMQEALRLLGADAPGPPRGWCLDLG